MRLASRLGRLLFTALAIGLAACQSGPSTTARAKVQRVAITAKAGRFEPAGVRLVQGTPAVLEFTRVVEGTCMQALRMPWMAEPVELPMNEKVEIAVDTSMSGVFSYSCWMNMVSGEVMIQPPNQSD